MRLQSIKLFGIVSSILVCFSSINWYDQRTSSGFIFRRVGILSYQMPDGDITDGFEGIPFEGVFLGVLSEILGLYPVYVIYLPIVTILAIPFIYAGMKLSTENEIPVLIGGALIIFHFAAEPHYKEYYITIPLFLIFSLTTFNFIFYSDVRDAFLTILMFISLHLWGPPISMWSVSLFWFLTLWFLISKYFHPSIKIRGIAGMAILSTVIYFWFNDKVFEQFIGNRLVDFLISVQTLFSPEEGPVRPYAYSVEHPDIYFISGALWYIIIFLPIIFGFLWNTYRGGISPFSRSPRELFLISLLLSTTTQMGLYFFLIGELRLRSLRLLGPIIAAYYLYKHCSRNLIKLFGLIIICISLINAGAIIGYGLNAPATDRDATSNKYNFHDEYGQGTFTSDFQTTEEILAVAGEYEEHPDDVPREFYSQDVMAMIIDGKSPPDNISEYIIINKNRLSHPTVSGIDWVRYYPLGYYYEDLNNRNDISKIYSDGYYDTMYIKGE